MTTLAAFQDMFAPEALNEALVPYIVEGRMCPRLVHPLVFEPLYTEALNRRINMLFAHKLQAVEAAVAAQDWRTFVALHERYDRLPALLKVVYVHEVTDPEKVWPLVGWVWTDNDNVWQFNDEWREVWSLDDLDNTFVVEQQELVMDEEERALLAAMPDTLTVYRGTPKPDLNGEGMSWTLNRDKAVWFAKRFREDGDDVTVITGTVAKRDVLAYFTGRNEDEIVVFPEYVTVERHDEV